MKPKDILILIVLGMCGGTIYLLPYMKYYFFNQMVESTGTSGQALGYLVTMFAIACLFVLLPGGILADRLSSKKCIFWSLISTTALTIIYGLTYQSYTLSLFIWFLLAFSTIFLAWPAIMKTVRTVGGERTSTAYSIYYASNGLTGALAGYITIKVYRVVTEHYVASGFFWSVMVSAIANGGMAFLLLYLLRDVKETIGDKSGKLPTLQDSYSVMKMPVIWFIAIVMFCTYSLYVGMTFFTPYLTAVFRVSDETSGTLSLVRSYVFMSITPFTGLIADRWMKSTLKWFTVATPIVIVCLIALISVRENADMIIPVMFLTMIAAFFVCTLYASMFSIMSECRIPMEIAGTAIGLVSIFSYTPDIIIQPLFGYFVDSKQYLLIFIMLAAMGALSVLSCILLLRNKAQNIPEPTTT
ncbi:MFS transporter [Klebsiella oxytoca]|uniref:MFS transporter n=1 Tax=Klebsiella oxytoca TaxID=571 RepID=UPI0025922F33|nr:MFS transporter [Klebsiella oxytoca]MDM4093037.1 MFS transporter [Klebsiella oxytoca]